MDDKEKVYFILQNDRGTNLKYYYKGEPIFESNTAHKNTFKVFKTRISAERNQKNIINKGINVTIVELTKEELIKLKGEKVVCPTRKTKFVKSLEPDVKLEDLFKFDKVVDESNRPYRQECINCFNKCKYTTNITFYSNCPRYNKI